MTTKTRAAIKAEHGAPLVVDEIELEDPGDEEVLVKLFATGICHSQLHQIFNLRAPMPVLLGHEGTGVILAAGSRVDHVRAGDRVMIQFVPRDLPEGQTVAARTKFRWRGAEYEADDSIIGCAVITGVGAALYTANVKAGQSVAVFGVGGVGTNVLAGARIAGADPIIAVDLQERKLEYARSLGATHTVNASDGEAAEAVKELTGGGVDFAFDTIGVEAASLQAVESVRAGVLGASRGGTAVIVGIGYEDLVLQRPRVFPYGERSLIGSMGGSMRPAHVMPQYVEWYREGKLPLEQLVTRRYDSLDDINEAVRALKDGEIDGRSIIVFDTP
jgi:Zn-dependent alcohol dehydrogenase